MNCVNILKFQDQFAIITAIISSFLSLPLAVFKGMFALSFAKFVISFKGLCSPLITKILDNLELAFVRKIPFYFTFCRASENRRYKIQGIL